jgi:hypothetical protein
VRVVVVVVATEQVSADTYSSIASPEVCGSPGHAAHYHIIRL